MHKNILSYKEMIVTYFGLVPVQLLQCRIVYYWKVAPTVPEDATDCVPEDITDVLEDITDVLEDITDALEDITDCAPGEWTEVDIDEIADEVSTLGWIVPPCGVTVIIVCFCFLFDTDFGFDFSFDLSFVSSKCMVVNSNIIYHVR